MTAAFPSSCSITFVTRQFGLTAFSLLSPPPQLNKQQLQLEKQNCDLGSIGITWRLFVFRNSLITMWHGQALCQQYVGVVTQSGVDELEGKSSPGHSWGCGSGCGRVPEGQLKMWEKEGGNDLCWEGERAQSVDGLCAEGKQLHPVGPKRFV